MLNELLLLSGTDIPFQSARISIHQPTIKEISYIGEKALFTGCELLNFTKEKLDSQDKINLESIDDFEILMSIMMEKNLAMSESKTYARLVLSLIFPLYNISFESNQLVLTKEGEEDKHIINNQNFKEFKQILVEMFCLKEHTTEDYNTTTERAKKIADKLKQGRVKAAQQKGESQKIALLSRYMSILAIGLQQDFNTLLNYTVYQLFDEFTRYELKQSFDLYIQAKMAGAKDLQDVDNWMKDIHE